jgi:hypothetical protein
MTDCPSTVDVAIGENPAAFFSAFSDISLRVY